MKYLYTASVVIAILISTICFAISRSGEIYALIWLAGVISPFCIFLDWYNNKRKRKNDNNNN